MRTRQRFILWPMVFIAMLVVAIVHLGSPQRADANTASVQRATAARNTQATYSVEAGLDGEIFPAFANYASLQKPKERPFGAVTVTITNSADSELKQRVSAQIAGWSDTETQAVTVAAGEVRKLVFAPAFLPRFYANHEIAAATAAVNITDLSGKVVYSDAMPVRLRSAEDIYWGPAFKFAPLIASWVTPHDPQVEAVLSLAKESMPGRRLAGYESWKSPAQQKAATLEQAAAIYRAVQLSGVSYVKSSLTFGRNPNVSERVRMPGDSIARKSANCIDGVVLYASLFENLGMDAEVVLVPGHAYVGVRGNQNSPEFVYIETSLTGRSPFGLAVHAASHGLTKWAEKDIMRIRISKARDSGIYPMPLPGHDIRHFPMEEATASTGSDTIQQSAEPNR